MVRILKKQEGECIMENIENLEDEIVYIKRQLNSPDGAKLPLSYFNDFSVTYVTGGYGINLSREYPCAYISEYDFGEKGFIACSGRHDYSMSGIKVIIMKKGTSPKAYRYIMEEVGLDPDAFYVKRPRGAAPCTKRIVQIINENGGNIKRGELRTKLKEEGYRVNIGAAIKSVIKSGKIYAEGPAQSRNQILITK